MRRAGILVGALLAAAAWAQDAVNVREEPVVIPTYRVGAAERNPVFYGGRSYQGAKGPVYPYPMLDRLSDEKENRAYRAVFLENRYVEYSILPEIGGRIFSGRDKTNGYDFIYRQQVIKPALIGMVGAWISGGVEWNIPHHHRASSFMPVDCRVVEDPDGSKTVWVGETEWRHRMRWIVGMTLWPDRSYLRITVRLFNRTPLPHSMLYFANIAVHANENYQVIFPPGTEFGAQHGKSEFVTWPMGSGRYGGVDRKGVDLSWWKNHRTPVSIFAWDYEDDFFGGYDHGKGAGMVIWADHNSAPGKKFFEWGNGSEGKLWDRILSDTDGPYLELMAGGYSDNQPDYSWVQPGETKVVEQWFYPVRGLGGVKNATRDAAVNLEVTGNTAKAALNTTGDVKDGRVVVAVKGKTVLDEKATISPDKPWAKEVKLEEAAGAGDVKVTLVSGGRELVSYQPRERRGLPMPKPVVPPGKPETIKTNEELYLAGLRLEQFYSPALEAEPYYREALRRDGGDYRANVAMGILCLRRGMYSQAEQYLETGVERAEHNYTRPKDGEALYYLGLARRAQGRLTEAEDCFHRAAWSAAWTGASSQQLAELACARREYGRALELADRALAANGLNSRAMNLRAMVLAKLGRWAESKKQLAGVGQIDPLDLWAADQLRRMTGGRADWDGAEFGRDQAGGWFGEQPQRQLELACDYGSGGLYEEAIDVLRRYVERMGNKGSVQDPLAYYHVGHYWAKSGERTRGMGYAVAAAKLSPDSCFPFQLESVEILKEAMKLNPKDAVAPYLLGNLLYDLQSAEAIEAWERSAQLNPGFATVHRNLGLAYSRLKDHAKAVGALERAVECDPQDPKLYAELDAAYEAGNAEPAKRLAMLQKNHEVVKRRDDALLREISMLMVTGDYDRAVELIEGHHFHLWEGESGLHDIYADAHLLRGRKLFAEQKHVEAMVDFDAMLQYPENLETAKPARGESKGAAAHYWRGRVFEAMENRKKAKECWEAAVKGGGGFSEASYWQGLAWTKLDELMMAKGTFEGLVRFGRERLAATEDVDFFAKFGTRRTVEWEKARAHYLIGLGLLGQGDGVAAKEEFEAVLRLNKSHLGATSMLQSLK